MDNLRDGATPPPELEALRRELAEARAELAAARHEQAAAADVLRIVSRQAADATPVFDAILEACQRLFSPYGAAINLIDGDWVKGVARRGFADGDWGTDATPLAGSSTGLAIAERRSVRIVDLAEAAGLPEHKRAAVRAYGGLTILYAPMISGERGVGSLVVARRPKQPFSDGEIASLSAFADQAVIAIENARLFEEVQGRTRDLEEALAQQTATADVLKVISRSAFDLDAVLQTLIDTAVRLARGSRGTIFIKEDEVLVARAFHRNVPEALRQHLSTQIWALDDDSHMARAVREKTVVHIPDLTQSETAKDREVSKRAAFGAGLWTPLMRDGEAIGVFGVPREAPTAFSEREIELVRTFADQAVIAIESARLFREVQARTRELQESLERQQASAEILRVISSSPTDVKPVFDAIATTAAALFECQMATVFKVDGARLTVMNAATRDGLWSDDALPPSVTLDPSANFPSRAVAEKRTLYIRDFSDPDINDHERAVSTQFGFRSALYMPLMRGGNCFGVFLLTSAKRDSFTDKDIALAESFRDQAQIAIENTSLFRETQDSLDQQTATANVLKTISRSAFDLDAIFQTLVTTAVDLCEASSGTLCVRDGEVFRYRGMAGPEASPELQRYLNEHPLATPTRQTAAGRAILSQGTEEIPDVLAEPDYAVPFAAHGSPARALLGVPLIGKTQVQGALVLARAEPGRFPQRQIETLKTFADQAVIAIENARLFEEVQARTRELELSLSDLRKAQDRLVQSEKLASLGQLTAGIAHEIKNPLNFVNNFAALSRDLLVEMKEAMARDERAEVEELAGLIDSNLEKVVHHGARADSIVKNMLLHSREGSGERRLADVNAMVEEALNLAYHGARAEKPGFNVTIEKALDPATGEADLYLQEIARVLINLIANGFYATARRCEVEGPDYQPTLKASTRPLGSSVEIRIRDNGAGVPDEVRAKMFNPFFTTKPAGEGTGLGLSLSHDIVVKQHGGTLEVETEPGEFAEFILTLPRREA